MWQICLTVGIVFLIMEMFIPSYFFLNLAVAAMVCAIIPAIYPIKLSILIIIFCILSMGLILVLRPILTKKIKNASLETGMDAKYKGKAAVAIEDIDKTKGAVTIYDERWQARNIDDGIILKGETVMIDDYEGLVMKVKKIC